MPGQPPERAFRFDVREGRLAAASSEPHVSLTASARDLVLLRRAPDAAAREEAKSRLRLDGNERAQARFRTLFDLTARPAVRPAAHT